MTQRGKVLAVALAIDLLAGEPPARLHPVVWMGRLVEQFRGRAPTAGPRRQLLHGAAVETVCLAGAALFGRLLDRGAGLPPWAEAIFLGIALKPTFALRALFDAVRPVESALAADDLPAARRAVARIVSREVAELDHHRVAAAAVESLAENASDSVVAPLFFYLAMGLPGAYLYRMANTLDAMLGYRGAYEYLGKAAARTDDLLNLVPSRLTALATVAGCWICGCSPRRAWYAMLRDGPRTASPNAGWPMAAAAGALDLRLEKMGNYVLNPAGHEPTAADLGRAKLVVGAGVAVAVAAMLLLSRRWPNGRQA